MSVLVAQQIKRINYADFISESYEKKKIIKLKNYQLNCTKDWYKTRRSPINQVIMRNKIFVVVAIGCNWLLEKQKTKNCETLECKLSPYKNTLLFDFLFKINKKTLVKFKFRDTIKNKKNNNIKKNCWEKICALSRSPKIMLMNCREKFL